MLLKIAHLVKRYESNNSPGMLQVAQLRAARALLGWRQEDIAQAAKISVATIRRIESQEGPLAGYVSTLVKIQAAFEHAGIQFIDDDELGGFGVRMAKKKRKR
jgi:transcriptional regulator with XRE-family HTH domain